MPQYKDLYDEEMFNFSHYILGKMGKCGMQGTLEYDVYYTFIETNDKPTLSNKLKFIDSILLYNEKCNKKDIKKNKRIKRKLLLKKNKNLIKLVDSICGLDEIGLAEEIVLYSI